MASLNSIALRNAQNGGDVMDLQVVVSGEEASCSSRGQQSDQMSMQLQYQRRSHLFRCKSIVS